MEWRGSKILILFFLLYALTANAVYAQHLSLDPDRWDKFRQGLEYNEKSPQSVEDPSIVKPVGLETWFEMLKIFILGVLILALTYLIIRVILIAKRPSKPKKDTPEIFTDEKIPTASASFETLWAQYHLSKNQGDYRECIRILYQISLKKLALNHWITTKAEKTNIEYINEIKKGEVADAFTRITHIHEYSWYGNSTLRADEFAAFEPRFINFINHPAIEKK